MAYPKQLELEHPLLIVIAKLGGEAKPTDIYTKVAEYFSQLTEDDLKRKMESSPSTYMWHSKVQWARQALINKGHLDGSIRGIWKITEAGRARAKRLYNIVEVRRVLHEDSSVIDSTNNANEKIDTSANVTLSDLLDNNVDAVKTRILDELKSLTPDAFENFCRLLFETLGYDNVVVTERGADGGIDGYGNFRQGVVHIKSAFQSKEVRTGIYKGET